MASQEQNNPWRDALTLLEQVLHGEEPITALAQLEQTLDGPLGLPGLFRLQLDTLVRRGPVGEGPGPRALLRLAQESRRSRPVTDPHRP